MNKTRKALMSVLTSIFVTVIGAVFAFAKTEDLSELVDSSVTATSIAKKIINTIKTPVQIAAVTIAIVLILVRGAILGAIQDERKRAEVGKTFLWIIISLFIVFFGVSIASVIINQIKGQATTSGMLSYFFIG